MTSSPDSLRAEKVFEQKQYALTRQVPDMAHGFTIVTAYGEIAISCSATSKRIAELVEKMLLDELAVQTKRTSRIARLLTRLPPLNTRPPIFCQHIHGSPVCSWIGL
jgi:hypothetical protein